MIKLIKMIYDHHKWILRFTGVLFLLSIIFFSKLGVASSFESVMPEDNITIKEMNAFKAYFPNEDMAVLVLQGDSDDILEVMPQIKEEIMASGVAETVIDRIDLDNLGPKKILYGPLAESGITFTNEKQTLYLMMIVPKLSHDNFMEDRMNFYKSVQEIIKDYKLNIGLTGGALIQDYEADTVAFDNMAYKVLITLLLVLIFIVIMFKSLKTPLLAVLPLVVGISMTGAIAYLLYNELNMFSATFVMLLIGLGIDFSVHLLMTTQIITSDLNIYFETISHTSKAIMMGALTTSVAFLAFLLADFKAFEQMGMISGIGILVLAIVTIIILVSLNAYKPTRKSRIINESNRDLLMFKKHRIKLLLLIGVILLLVFPNVLQFEVIGDMNKIYPSNMPSKAYENLLIEEMNYDVNKLSVLVDLNDSMEIIEIIGQLNHVKTVESIYDFLPAEQEETIALLKANGVEISAISIEELPNLLKSQYISRDKMRIEIVPDFNIYDADLYQELSNEIKSITGHMPVGMAALMNEVVDITQKDILKVSVICLMFILISLLLMYRKISLMIITSIPVMITIFTTIGLLPLFGRDINIFSIAAFPLILGIGIDSGIHLMESLLNGHQRMINNTVKAVFITSVTTIIGFSSLTFINHPGMANLGFTVALGMVLNFIMTLILLPISYDILLKN